MTEPPYSRVNNQRPKYVKEMQLSWSGVPLFNSKMYVAKVAGTAEELVELQLQEGVIDFPNVDEDLIKDLPQARKDKNTKLLKALKMKNENNEKVVDFINRSANSELDHGWKKDLVFVYDK